MKKQLTRVGGAKPISMKTDTNLILISELCKYFLVFLKNSFYFCSEIDIKYNSYLCNVKSRFMTERDVKITNNTANTGGNARKGQRDFSPSAFFVGVGFILIVTQNGINKPTLLPFLYKGLAH